MVIFQEMEIFLHRITKKITFIQNQLQAVPMSSVKTEPVLQSLHKKKNISVCDAFYLKQEKNSIFIDLCDQKTKQIHKLRKTSTQSRQRTRH